MMVRAGKKNSNNRGFQFRQQNNEPIELNTNVLLNNIPTGLANRSIRFTAVQRIMPEKKDC